MDAEKQIVPDTGSSETSNELSRRSVLAGVAATTVAAGVAVPASAQDAGPIPRQDMIAFVFLSAALTGIAEGKLATGFGPLPQPPTPVDLQQINPGSDPVDIKQDYFKWVMGKSANTFQDLLKIARDNVNGLPDRASAIINAVKSKDDTKFLARSIVLMWYLGAWYDPKELQQASTDPNSSASFKVISPKAYTQGWALRVARAHTMGFSQMQFGYWHEIPNPLPDFVGGSVT